MRAPTCVFVIAALASVSAADADTISAERPGFASGPVPLERGRVQLEGGYQFDKDGSVDIQTLPLLLFRTGLGENLELQVGWPGYTEVDFPGGSIDGINDLTVGLKTQLRDNNDALDVGVYGALSVPIGDREFTSDAVDPTAGVFWTYSRPNQPTVFGTVLASSATIADDRELTAGASIGLGFAIDPQWGAYAEVFSLFGAGAPAHVFNGGFTYLVNDDLQLDFEGGVGLSDNAGDWFFGFGAARRW